MEKLDQVYDSVTNIDNALTSAQEELIRVQAWIKALKATREVRTTEGSALESIISTIFSNIDCFHEELVKQGDQIRSSLTEEEYLCKCLLSAFPK